MRNFYNFSRPKFTFTMQLVIIAWHGFIHGGITKIISLRYHISLWHRRDEPIIRELRIKFCFCIYYSLFPPSLVVGATNSDNYDDSIYSAEVTTYVGILSLNLSIFILMVHCYEVLGNDFKKITSHFTLLQFKQSIATPPTDSILTW